MYTEVSLLLSEIGSSVQRNSLRVWSQMSWENGNSIYELNLQEWVRLSRQSGCFPSDLGKLEIPQQQEVKGGLVPNKLGRDGNLIL